MQNDFFSCCKSLESIDIYMSSSDKIGKKVALVTGCTEGGIGHAIATELHQQGIFVFFSARRVDSIGPIPDTACKKVELDVCSDKSVQAAISSIIDELGHIDILVNNAGVGCVGPVAEVSLADASSCLEINIIGSIRCVQCVAPHMVKQGSGKIVNIGSIVGLIGTPWAAVYSASKAAVHNLTDVLRLEMQPFGIKVMTVAPGAVRSNIGRNNESRLDLSLFKIFSRYKGSIEARASASQSSKSTPTDLFAKQVVQQVLKPNPPSFFVCGHMKWLFLFFSKMPRWFVDLVLRRMFKL